MSADVAMRRIATATVIGGGPAGLMAAEVLATAGLAVTVYEHMPSVGRRLLLAGRGGLNLTHSEPLEEMLCRYGVHRQRLEPAIRAFSPTDLREWCAALGESTFVGSSGRVFPSSFRATPLLRAWLGRLAGLGVSIDVRQRWMGWVLADDGSIDPRRSIFRDRDGGDHTVTSDVTVIALGGASWPRVGSDGAWTSTMRAAGIEITDLVPSNCGFTFVWTDDFARRFAGVPLKNVAVGVGGVFVRGDAMVTSAGLEGGPVYAHSAAIRQAIDLEGRCKVTLDLQPDLSTGELVERLDRRRPKDSLTTALKRTIGLSPTSIGLLREATENHMPTESVPLARLIKTARLVTTATMPIDRAISTAGGIAMSEIDETFMLRRLPGTFVAGEMLDWEAPTGGYLLQASFSTAVAAAQGACAWAATASAR